MNCPCQFRSSKRLLFGVVGGLLIPVVVSPSLFGQDNYAEMQKIVADQSAPFATFGADAVIQGDVALIGMGNDGADLDLTGAAFVYRRQNGEWTLEQKLVASGLDEDSRFGTTVALDGDVAVIGAWSQGSVGAAYVFRRNPVSGLWIEEAELTPSSATTFSSFGAACDIDGDVILVGAVADDVDGVHSTGSAFVYGFDGNQWLEQQKLVASDRAEEDRFGAEVAIDGGVLAISAPWEDDPARSGSIYVFNHDGNQWTESQKLKANDGRPRDELGTSLDLEGNRLVSGAFHDDPSGDDSGSAYLFQFNGTDWVQGPRLVASDGQAGDIFGFSVALDGNLLVVGAPRADETGAAYVFEREATTWTERQKILPCDAASTAFTANAVGIHAGTVAVSSVGADASVGATYVYGPLAVSGVAPPVGPRFGGNRIVVSGEGFTSESRVFFDGTAARSVTCIDENTLEVVVPRLRLGMLERAMVVSRTVDVEVSQGCGVARMPASYTYLLGAGSP